MKHFRSIDGLRAWLAWIVVLSHVTLYTGADLKLGVLAKAEWSATYAVCVFIIISGFVIAHLLMEKHERYVPYITRRLLRIYPVYLICLCLGIAATYLHFQAFADHPWGDIVPQSDLLAAEVASLDHGDFTWHLAAHLALLHGAISNHLLPMSEYMLLGPAWSLSLEWQFYLVAPFVLLALRTRKGQVLTALAAVMAYGAYRQGWVGQFYDPSFLPGAGLYFALGIATRVLFTKLPMFESFPLAVMIIAFGVCLMSHDMLPFVIWMAFIAWLRTDPASALTSRVFDRAFNSKLTQYLGTRSYSTYLIHEPIIHIAVFVCIKWFALTLWPTFLATLLVTVSFTLAASAFLYRFVEAPAIAFGRRLFSQATGTMQPARVT